MFPGCQRALEARNGGPLRPHSLCHLCLSKTGLLPGFQQRVEEFCCLPFDTLNLDAHAGAAHEALDQLIMCFHVSPSSINPSPYKRKRPNWNVSCTACGNVVDYQHDKFEKDARPSVLFPSLPCR